jgi:hypothetical protein
MTHESPLEMSPSNESRPFSEMSISENLKKSISELGYITPTLFQKDIWENFNLGKHIVGLGQSSYGKSLAFSLPIVAKIDTEQAGAQALIITESNMACDLAVKECKALSRHLPNVVVKAVNGVDLTHGEEAEILVMSSADLSKIGELDGLAGIKTLFVDSLSFEKTVTVIETLGKALLSPTLQVMVAGGAAIKAFEENVPKILAKAARIDNADVPKVTIPAQHIVHLLKEEEPKPKALLAALELHNPKKALITCLEASECELLGNFLSRYGFRSETCHDNKNRHQVGEAMATFAQQKDGILIVQQSLLVGQPLGNVPFMIVYDMHECPEDYEAFTEFNKQALGLKRIIVSLASNRESGLLGPIRAKCLINMDMVELPDTTEVLALSAKRIVDELSTQAAGMELAQFELLAHEIAKDASCARVLAFLLRGFYLNKKTEAARPASGSTYRERRFGEERNAPRRDDRGGPREPRRPMERRDDARPESSASRPQAPRAPETTDNDGICRLYVTLGRQDGFDDLASLAQFLSDKSTVDLGHFTGSGMIRDHSAHIEVDSEVAEKIMAGINGLPRPGATSPTGEQASVVCERAKPNPTRMSHHQQRRPYQPRRRSHPQG